MANGLNAIITMVSCLTLLSCATAKSSSANDIYYGSQEEADTALAAFEKENPSCELWSNWQKMCSRTGLEGQVHCNKADTLSVKPSATFCVAKPDEQFSGPGADATSREISSFFRFCEVPPNFEGSYEEKREACNWDKSRPFAGRSLTELSHPWCKTWRLTKALDETDRHYYCSRRDIPKWCAHADGMGYGVQDDQTTVNVGIYTILNRESLPLNGIYCRWRKLDVK
ncbi:MAG: hypothetical protein QUV08_14140 [Parasphingorhabdus sp.]|nr:hypothetical protein [Parasphingorhabdus sp.]